MQQILSIWSNLDPRRRIIAVLASIGMFAAVLGLSHLATQPSMGLLYAGLEPGAAGEVVKSLEARGVDYDIRGSSIFVPTPQRDELRLTLASEGLPSNSSQGYELLDSLSGFGTTSQMFDAAYWRAKEGELARTIVSNSNYRSARVHIAAPNARPFQRGIDATASVTVTGSDGQISGAQAKALRYLVASAVAGLSSDNVSIIDGRNGLYISGDDAPSATAQGTDREEELRRNVERMLEARVGVGRAVVEVSVDTETDQESIVERRFDPEGRVAVSSETEELSNSATDSRGSDVTVASNLPSGNEAGGGNSSSNNSEVRERINYEVSETRHEIQRGPGAVRRISVAVLVDGLRTIDADTGEITWAPRSAEELQALETLVASAVGFDEERGDIITIQNMQFETVPDDGTVFEPSLFASMHLNVMTLIQLAVLSIVTLVLGLFVLRPMFTRPGIASAAAPMGLPSPMNAQSQAPNPISIPAPPNAPPPLNGEIDQGFELPTMGVVSDFDLGDDDIGIPTDPVKRLRQLIEDRQDETVEILRGWMEDEEETAS